MDAATDAFFACYYIALMVGGIGFVLYATVIGNR